MVSLDGNGYFISVNEGQILNYLLKKILEERMGLGFIFGALGNEAVRLVYEMIGRFNDGADVRRKILPEGSYVSVVIDGESYPEHRFVYYKATHPGLTDREVLEIAKKRGKAGKIIHHIDGDKHNNDIFNLVEIDDNKEHRRCHSYIYESPAERFSLMERTVKEIGKGYLYAKIVDVEMPIRIVNALTNSGIVRIVDIYKLGIERIKQIKSMGESSIVKLDKMLTGLNLPSICASDERTKTRIEEIIKENL